MFFLVPCQISIPDDHHMSNTQLTTSGSFAELLLPEFWFSSPVINMSNLCFKKSLQMIPMPSPVCDPLASLSQRKVSTTEAVLGLPSLHRWTVLCWLWPKDPVSRKAALIPIFLSFAFTVPDPRVSFLTPGLLWILRQVKFLWLFWTKHIAYVVDDFLKLNLLEWHWLIKLYRFQVCHSDTSCVYCIVCPKPNVKSSSDNFLSEISNQNTFLTIYLQLKIIANHAEKWKQFSCHLLLCF